MGNSSSSQHSDAKLASRKFLKAVIEGNASKVDQFLEEIVIKKEKQFFGNDDSKTEDEDENEEEVRNDNDNDDDDDNNQKEGDAGKRNNNSEKAAAVQEQKKKRKEAEERRKKILQSLQEDITQIKGENDATALHYAAANDQSEMIIKLFDHILYLEELEKQQQKNKAAEASNNKKNTNDSKNKNNNYNFGLVLSSHQNPKQRKHNLLKSEKIQSFVNSRDSNGFTPLHVSKQLSVIRLLLEAGADVNARTSITANDKKQKKTAEGNFSALHFACALPNHRQNEAADIVAELIAAGCDRDAVTQNGNSALHFAALTGNSLLVRGLVTVGSGKEAPTILEEQNNQAESTKKKPSSKKEVATTTTQDRDEKIRKEFEEIHFDFINKKNLKNETPLLYACRSGSKVAVDVLLAAGADTEIFSTSPFLGPPPSSKDAFSVVVTHWSPLTAAIFSGNFDIVQSLIFEHGARQILPLHLAQKYRSLRHYAMTLFQNNLIWQNQKQQLENNANNNNNNSRSLVIQKKKPNSQMNLQDVELSISSLLQDFPLQHKIVLTDHKLEIIATGREIAFFDLSQVSHAELVEIPTNFVLSDESEKNKNQKTMYSATGTPSNNNNQNGTCSAAPAFGHSYNVLCCAFSHLKNNRSNNDDDDDEDINGNDNESPSLLLATGAADKSICIWDAQSGTLRTVIKNAHSSGVRALCFSQDDSVLYSGAHSLRAWGVETGLEMCEPLKEHGDKIISLAVTKWGEEMDGDDQQDFENETAITTTSTSFLASGSFREIFLWDVSTGKKTNRKTPAQHINLIQGLQDRVLKKRRKEPSETGKKRRRNGGPIFSPSVKKNNNNDDDDDDDGEDKREEGDFLMLDDDDDDDEIIDQQADYFSQRAASLEKNPKKSHRKAYDDEKIVIVREDEEFEYYYDKNDDDDCESEHQMNENAKTSNPPSASPILLIKIQQDNLSWVKELEFYFDFSRHPATSATSSNNNQHGGSVAPLLRLYSSSEDGLLRMWNVESLLSLANGNNNNALALEPLTRTVQNSIISFSVSPSQVDPVVAVASTDGIIRLFDAATLGEKLLPLQVESSLLFNNHRNRRLGRAASEKKNSKKNNNYRAKEKFVQTVSQNLGKREENKNNNNINRSPSPRQPRRGGGSPIPMHSSDLIMDESPDRAPENHPQQQRLLLCSICPSHPNIIATATTVPSKSHEDRNSNNVSSHNTSQMQHHTSTVLQLWDTAAAKPMMFSFTSLNNNNYDNNSQDQTQQKQQQNGRLPSPASSYSPTLKLFQLDQNQQQSNTNRNKNVTAITPAPASSKKEAKYRVNNDYHINNNTNKTTTTQENHHLQNLLQYSLPSGAIIQTLKFSLPMRTSSPSTDTENDNNNLCTSSTSEFLILACGLRDGSVKLFAVEFVGKPICDPIGTQCYVTNMKMKIPATVAAPAPLEEQEEVVETASVINKPITKIGSGKKNDNNTKKKKNDKKKSKGANSSSVDRNLIEVEYRDIAGRWHTVQFSAKTK